MADVIDIAEHLPEVDPDLIESLRIMLKEAQGGRLVSFAAVYTTDDGDLLTVLHFASTLELIGATALLHRDALNWPDDA